VVKKRRRGGSGGGGGDLKRGGGALARGAERGDVRGLIAASGLLGAWPRLFTVFLLPPLCMALAAMAPLATSTITTSTQQHARPAEHAFMSWPGRGGGGVESCATRSFTRSS